MQVTNIKYHRDVPFEDYLSMAGTSYSGIKGFQGQPTTGMRLGTRVHQYLNEPENFDWHDATAVVKMGTAIKSYLGDAYHYLEKEVTVTADFLHNGMKLKYKGRIDMLKIGRLVVDVKILNSNIEQAVPYFGYDKQLSGYCLGSKSPMAMIISYNKLKSKVEVKAIKPDATYWEYQTVRLGQPA